MKDPTIVTVDDEPWNQPAEPKAAQVIQIETALSPAQRAFYGLPVFAADGSRARFIYELTGYPTWKRTCWSSGCGVAASLTLWTEKEYAPDDPVAKKYGREYRVVRDVMLCPSCTKKLKALPLGQRWNPG